MYWINATGDYVNVRSIPNITSRIVRTVSANGALVQRRLSSECTDGDWYAYEFSDGTAGWIRNDVHKWIEIETVQLPVPYKSQNDVNANLWPNDCGPASLAMMMALASVDKTVNEVSRRAGLVGRNFAHFNDLIRAAASYGFEAVHRRPAHLTDILASLMDGYPVLSLINYAVLKPGKNYGHFVTVVGCVLSDGKLDMLIHDPNDRPFAVYPAEQFAAALGNTNPVGNMPFQSLIFSNWDDYPVIKEGVT